MSRNKTDPQTHLVITHDSIDDWFNYSTGCPSINASSDGRTIIDNLHPIPNQEGQYGVGVQSVSRTPPLSHTHTLNNVSIYLPTY